MEFKINDVKNVFEFEERIIKCMFKSILCNLCTDNMIKDFFTRYIIRNVPTPGSN